MRSQKGQSIVETALIIPILLILLFGITDFARIFHAYLTLDHAGREAARAATVGATDSEIELKIANTTSGLDQSKLEETISPGDGNRKSGSEITITLTYPVDFLTPIIGQIIEEFPLKDETVMRVE
ncbi:pilus assembly protein TadE [Virgibacillus phasianinus]|uniref:Pilus assembly protein TadE n=1 Tax=Virgibacillus phasianinus TaxID=2017483 RepID=A0A220U1L6_9BACI|nr:TadE/TadG family type IV pilus assembly protein [Virgibacillus phasianinus]ASK61826.1 pilus assembly protein TadE [Virgibacillus phasianinus]